MNRHLVYQLALQLIAGPNISVSAKQIEQAAGRPVEKVINLNWVQTFLDSRSIVSRKRTGNHYFSNDKELEKHRRLAFHLGELKRSYENGLSVNCVENLDYCHSLIDHDDGRCLKFSGTKKINYGIIASGEEGIKVCLRLSGAENCKIEAPFIVFQNPSGNYPIQVLDKNVEGIYYRSQR